MKYLFTLFVSLTLFACNNEDAYPETAMDTARAFIRSSLDGEFEKAELLLLNDQESVDIFKSYKRYYEKMPAETKMNYKKSNFQINEFLDVNDSTTIINYSNNYMNKPMEIKLVRNQERWKVDFKYTTSGNLPIK